MMLKSADESPSDHLQAKLKCRRVAFCQKVTGNQCHGGGERGLKFERSELRYALAEMPARNVEALIVALVSTQRTIIKIPDRFAQLS
jgi:hypothetical protein